MKKVLIISYFFPPCNLTAANRIQGWANYLNDFGYYPVIITRNWDLNIEKPEDVLKSSGSEIIHTKTNQYEVYSLPYKANLRDRIFVKYQGKPLQKVSRVLTFLNLITENITVKSIPHSNLYFFARKLLKEKNDFHALIVSGNPFNQFSFGFLLKKEFDIQWIADYRDDWNTNELVEAKKGIHSFVRKLQMMHEKKWVNSAACFTSVSDYYVSKISAFTNKKGVTIQNGFEIDSELKKSTIPNEFIITYSGSLYSLQPIETFLLVVERLISEGYSEIKLKFPGLAFDSIQKQRVESCSKNFSDHLEITSRITHKEVLSIQAKSDLLLILAYANIKGIPSSKLYEYIGLKKRILLFPSDEDVIEETLNEVGLGIIPKDADGLYQHLKVMLDQKRSGSVPASSFNLAKIETYSRKEQTRKLAKVLDNL